MPVGLASRFAAVPAWVPALGLGCAVFLAVWFVRVGGALEHLELITYDQCIRMRAAFTTQPSREVVLVGITEKDIQDLGQWPLSDAYLARLLETILECHPRAIGLDIFRDVSVPPGSADLTRVLTWHPEIVVASKFDTDPQRRILPPPALSAAPARVGLVDLLLDYDGLVRRGLLYLDDAGTVKYAFALRLALLHLQPIGVALDADPIDPSILRLGATSYRRIEPNEGGYVGIDAAGYQILLDFRRGRSSFRSFTLESIMTGHWDRELLRDAVVIVGSMAESVKDLFYTPLDTGWRAAGPSNGIEVHAHVVNQLIDGARHRQTPIRSPSEAIEALWILTWGLLGAGLGFTAGTTWIFALGTSLGLAILASTGFAVFLLSWWIPLVPAAFTWTGSAAIAAAYRVKQERAERSVLMQLFSRHVAGDVADMIWQQRHHFMDRGRPRPQRLTATVLFTDLAGFTSVSEKLPAPNLMDWLNEYMEGVATQVMRHGGVIDKYIGDAIMGVFGIPLARHEEFEIDADAVRAVDCALAMEKTLADLNRTWKGRGLPEIGMRVGIFTGPVVAGSLGSSERLEYTVIGDTVNTASRLESFDKQGDSGNLVSTPCRILIGETTARRLGNRFVTKGIGPCRLKGKEEPVVVHQVLGRNRIIPAGTQSEETE